MLRGYLTGGLSGLVVSAVGLGTASLIAEQPPGNQPPQRPVVESPDIADVAGTTDADGVVPDVTADAGGAPAPSNTPEVVVDGSATPEVQTDTSPLQQPDAGEVTAGLSAPQVTDDPVVGAATDTPVEGADGGAVPAVPDNEADIVLETTTPPPPEVVVVEDEPTEDAGEDEPVVVVVIDEEAEAEAEADAGVETTEAEDGVEEPAVAEDMADEAGSDETAEDMADAVTDVADEGADAMADAVTDASAGQEEGTATADAGTETTADASADPSAAPVMIAPEVNETLPVTPSTDEAEEEGSLIALQGDDARLPGQVATRIIGADEEAAETEETVVEEAAPVVPGTALAAFAADFDLPPSTPSLSVILVDDGSLSDGAAALAAVPFVVTVAIDPASEGAAERMAAYREAGIEIMAMAGVPAGAQSTDVEVALQAGFATLPDAIGLLDIGQAGLQTDRVLAAQAMTRLAEDGRGFVTLSQGLNSGLRAADEADVPATTIYRDLDSNDQDARVIRRFLDQAAFRARQQGSVVLVARVRADTISALVLWHTANAGGEVVMAPVSAVLLADQG